MPFLIRIIGICLSLLLLSCVQSERSVSQQGPRLFLRYADEQSISYPSTAAVHEFVRICQERAEGDILVRIYDGGRLGDEAAIVEQLRFGGIDLARIYIHNVEEFSSTARRLGSFGSFKSPSEMDNIMNGPEGAALASELLKEKIVVLTWYDGGPECRLEPKTRPPYMGSNLKVGVEPSRTRMELVSSLGDTPVPLGLGEFKHAYITGLADAFIMPLLSAESEQLLESHRPVHTTPSRALELLVASRAVFQKMLPKDRELILWAAAESRKHQENLRFSAETALQVSIGFLP